MMRVAVLFVFLLQCVRFISAWCIYDDKPVVGGCIKLPNGKELLPFSEFESKIVGLNMHSMITGLHPSLQDRVLDKAELLFTRPSDSTVRVDLKALVGGSCVNEDVFRNSEFDTFFRGNRAEFKASSTGTYVSVFSSNPDSYAWVLVCRNHENGMRRCPATDLNVILYTTQNPPHSINFEWIGRDLRLRTCLTMEDITDEFMFQYTQGTNTCEDN